MVIEDEIQIKAALDAAYKIVEMHDGSNLAGLISKSLRDLVASAITYSLLTKPKAEAQTRRRIAYNYDKALLVSLKSLPKMFDDCRPKMIEIFEKSEENRR